MNLAAGKGLRARNYCMDCTPDYKAEQQELGLCAYPGTRFFRFAREFLGSDGEPELVGLRHPPTAEMERWILGEEIASTT